MSMPDWTSPSEWTDRQSWTAVVRSNQKVLGPLSCASSASFVCSETISDVNVKANKEKTLVRYKIARTECEMGWLNSRNKDERE